MAWHRTFTLERSTKFLGRSLAWARERPGSFAAAKKNSPAKNAACLSVSRLFSSCAHTQSHAKRYHHDPQTGWLDRRWCPVLVAGAGTIAARRSFAEQELKERLVFFDREVPSARPLYSPPPAEMQISGEYKSSSRWCVSIFFLC